MLPNNLREYAKLDKETVIVGVSTRVEIWSKAEWDRYNTQAEASFEELAEKIVDLL
ncbi:hypothetical protein N752_09145 [Desulforamulus aquiferis]|nr:hypothetical protein N752_09145 [Desulforamulus aquiferis]